MIVLASRQRAVASVVRPEVLSALGAAWSDHHRSPAAQRWGGNSAVAVAALALLIAMDFVRVAPSLPLVASEGENVPAIDIVLEEQAAPPTPDEAAAPPASLSEVAATFVPQPETGAADGDATEDVMPSIDVPQGPPSFENWRPSAEEASQIAGMGLAISDSSADLQKRRMGITEGIQQRRIEAHGREFTLNSDGGVAGVIRTIDFSAVPEDRAVPILTNKYGITFETKHVTPKAGRNFVNAAKTEGGTFTTAAEAGVYDVFTLSPKAISMMAALELKALQDRGYNPGTTRVLRVEFGLIPSGDGDYELAVTKLEAERIR